MKEAGAILSRRARVASAAVVMLFSLALYYLTLAPTVTLVDSGELIAAAEEPGVAHPPGFPLYILLAHLATLVPLGSIAERVNFASALFASTASAALTLTVHEAIIARHLLRQAARKLTKKKDRSQKPSKSASYEAIDQEPPTALSRILSLAPGVMAGLLLASSRTLWSYATIAEVYALNTLLILAVFYFCLRWRRARLEATSSDRYLYIAAFVFGLALGVHHVTVAILLPALAALIISTEGARFFKSKRLLYAALASLGGLTVYIYLPVAAKRSPLVNWGDPRTLERFWWHVTGRQYQDFFSFSLERVFDQFGGFFALAGREFGPWWLPLGLLLAATGFYAVFRGDKPLFRFLALAVITDLAYALNYEIAEDKDAYYLPAFVAMVIAAGAGARWLIALSGSLRLPRVAAVAMLLLLPVISFAASMPFNNRSRYFVAQDYIDNILSTIGPNGMLLTLDWQVYSPMMYFRKIEKWRADLMVIDVNHLRRSWYYDYLRRAYPALMEKNRDKVDAFLEDLNNWERDPDLYQRDVSLNQRINGRFYEMIRSLVASHAEAAPVYITQELATSVDHRDGELTRSLASAYQFIPQGLVFELAKGREFREPAEPQLKMRGLFDDSLRFADDDVVRIKILPVYISMITNRGLYLAAHGQHERAIEHFNRSLTLDPGYTPARQGLNESLKSLRAAQPAKWR